ncbi:hypothetical protein PIB30_066186 [Stylosanthes scabra]|uniref:Uncharacterized protein n=1 Tax=Stylosanthes scabra TaxID=79078 RepID=A0ABU6RMJ8_9FABA|nr:hypothetical protein [Stylosanthes scabra]
MDRVCRMWQKNAENGVSAGKVVMQKYEGEFKRREGLRWELCCGDDEWVRVAEEKWMMRVATKPILSTHRRRKPRICVVDQQAHTRPTHMRDSDIVKPQSSRHRRRRSTHMCGRHLGSKQPRMTHA